MLTDEDQRVRQPVERHRQPAARRTHHELMLFQLFAVFVKNRQTYPVFQVALQGPWRPT
jgi:hypothetical protein